MARSKTRHHRDMRELDGEYGVWDEFAGRDDLQ